MSEDQGRSFKLGNDEYFTVVSPNGRIQIHENDGDHFCTMPTTVEEAAHLRRWAFDSGLEAGKRIKADEIRRVLGAASEAQP
jgi:hypothetical protein